MRRLTSLLLVLAVLPQVAQAQSARVHDRYGAASRAPEPVHIVTPQAALVWSGKRAEPAPALPQQPQRPEPYRAPAAAPQAPQAAQAPSIYAPPALLGAPRQAAAAPVQAPPAPATRPRLYSVHREFGLAPDQRPAPMPRRGSGQEVALTETIDAPAPAADDGAYVERRRVTNAKGETTTVERTVRPQGAPQTGVGAGDF